MDESAIWLFFNLQLGKKIIIYVEIHSWHCIVEYVKERKNIIEHVKTIYVFFSPLVNVNKILSISYKIQYFKLKNGVFITPSTA